MLPELSLVYSKGRYIFHDARNHADFVVVDSLPIQSVYNAQFSLCS